MKPICFIGARGGSKGVPRKNTRIIAGKPLIAHTIEAANNSNIFQCVMVSTEDAEIASIAMRFGAEVPFIRPKKLATDDANMNNVLVHGIKKMLDLGYKFNVIVNCDCTAPFIRYSDISGSLHLLKKKRCDAVFAVYEQHHNPYFNMMELDSKGFLKFSKKLRKEIYNRQDAPKVYQLTGFHTLDISKFLKYGTTSKLKAIPYVVPIETGLMIDTEYEFKIAELIFENKENFAIQS